MYLYNGNFIVHACEISKKKKKKNFKSVSEKKILTVEDLPRNVLSKKMYIYIYIYNKIVKCVCIIENLKHTFHLQILLQCRRFRKDIETFVDEKCVLKDSHNS